MAAYNFQKQFVPKIQDWSKTQTIRRKGKRRHAKPGERVQLYTGQRTKYCRKIVEPDPLCTRVADVDIYIFPEEGEQAITGIDVDGSPVDDLEAFARSDGFDDLDLMGEFWLDFHGVGTFEGLMIHWEKPNGEQS